MILVADPGRTQLMNVLFHIDGQSAILPWKGFTILSTLDVARTRIVHLAWSKVSDMLAGCATDRRFGTVINSCCLVGMNSRNASSSHDAARPGVLFFLMKWGPLVGVAIDGCYWSACVSVKADWALVKVLGRLIKRTLWQLS